MERELGNLPHLRMTGGFRLASSGVQGDHDLAEQSPAGRQHITIGERQDIGRPIVAEKTSIEISDPIVARQQHVDLAGVVDHALETLHDQPPERLSRGAARPSFAVELNSVNAVGSSC